MGDHVTGDKGEPALACSRCEYAITQEAAARGGSGPERCTACLSPAVALDGAAWVCGACGATGEATPAPKIGGPRSLYPGKLRGRPLTATVTPECHLMVAALAGRLGLSKSDVVEHACRALHAREGLS